METPRWQPILGEARGGRAWEAVEEIASTLGSEPPDLLGEIPTLGRGAPGPAIFFTYLHLGRPGGDYADLAVAYLERAIEQTGSTVLAPMLYSGFLGTAWAAQHMEGRILEPDDEEDFNEDIDEAVLQVLEPPGFGGDYDLIRGVVGLGVYALERLPRPSARECLKRVVDDLETRAREMPPGLAWWTRKELVAGIEPRSDGQYNLGVAHGMPAVVGLLGELVEAGVERERARALLEGGVDWMLAQELTDSERSLFPAAIEPGQEPSPTRTAWCYGDPGIAAVLMRAARAAGRADWEEKALDVAYTSLTRPLEKTGVEDAGLCHGAAGLAHLANRFFHATGDERFRDAAAAWFERVLDMRRPGEGVAGYSAWLGYDKTWDADPGFLTGAVGVGLALLGALTPVEPSWDRLLLTSIPPLGRG